VNQHLYERLTGREHSRRLGFWRHKVTRAGPGAVRVARPRSGPAVARALQG